MNDEIPLTTQHIEKAFNLEAEQVFKGAPWIRESWVDPSEFWRNLKRLQDSFYPVPGGSQLWGKYDFYHDILYRNRNNPHPAMVWFDGEGERCEMDYAALGMRLPAGPMPGTGAGSSPVMPSVSCAPSESSFSSISWPASVPEPCFPFCLQRGRVSWSPVSRASILS